MNETLKKILGKSGLSKTQYDDLKTILVEEIGKEYKKTLVLESAQFKMSLLSAVQQRTDTAIKQIEQTLTTTMDSRLNEMQQQLDQVAAQVNEITALIQELLTGEAEPNTLLLEIIQRLETLEQSMHHLQMR